MVGLALSLSYGWVLDPRSLPARPADLSTHDKEIYLRLIAAAFNHDRDEQKAGARLAALASANHPDPEMMLVNLTERYILEERDVRDTIALVALADALGRTSGAMAAFLATPTPEPTSTPTPAPTPTPRPTQTPTPLTPIPTATSTPTPSRTPTPSQTPTSTQTPGPTRTPTSTRTQTPTPVSTSTQTPTPGPASPFGLAQSTPLCDETEGGLLRIYIRDRLGAGVPGVEIMVRWSGGRDSFFTGLKPDVDPGYADFQMRPGETYQVELVSLETVGQIPEINLSSEDLCPNLLASTVPSWQIVFQQGVSR